MVRSRSRRHAVTVRRRGTVVPIESRIQFVRREKVILDSALAELYGVPVKRLNEQVRRNRERFPSDFMFQLTRKEQESLRLQSATSNPRRGGRRYLPYVFTEHGAIMAATVLNSPCAVAMSVHVVRAFVRLRQLLLTNRALATRVDQMENRIDEHGDAIRDLLGAIRRLMRPPSRPRGRIGFELPALKPAS
jgi:hypothetical protein